MNSLFESYRVVTTELDMNQATGMTITHQLNLCRAAHPWGRTRNRGNSVSISRRS